MRDCPKKNDKNGEDANIAVDGQFDDKGEFAIAATATGVDNIPQDETLLPTNHNSSAEHGETADETADEIEQPQAFFTMETYGEKEGVAR